MSLPKPRSTRVRVQRLPLLPLADTVLIPGALLPLQVVEPRYLKLLQDSLASDRMVALVLAAGPGGALSRIAGVGRIQSSEELESGRRLVVIEGRARAEIIEEVPTLEPYRTVRLVLVDDVVIDTTPGEIFASTQALRQLVVELAHRLPDQSGDSLAEVCVAEPDPGHLADLIASTILLDSESRQGYLEEANVGRRLDFMLSIVAQVVAAVGEREGVHLSN